MSHSDMPQSNRSSSASAGATCAHPWCTTAHGKTLHPDDEDHRSAGIFFSGMSRGDDSTEYDTEFELGLLRRHDESSTWLVIDQGAVTRLAIRIDTARRAIELLHDDDRLSAALGLSGRATRPLTSD